MGYMMQRKVKRFIRQKDKTCCKPNIKFNYPKIANSAEAWGKRAPVICEREAIKHISGISARTIHGRHSCSLFTASILQNSIEQHLTKRHTYLDSARHMLLVTQFKDSFSFFAIKCLVKTFVFLDTKD